MDRLSRPLATCSRDPGFARIIEPRVAPPEARLRVLEEAARRGIRTVAHVAPVLPVNSRRPWLGDLEAIVSRLAEIGVDYVYAEVLYARGKNMLYVRSVLGEEIRIDRGFRCIRGGIVL